jgi:hypothetical protein
MANTRKGPATAPSELICSTKEFDSQIENREAPQPQDDEIPFGQLENFGSPPTGLLAVLLAPRRWFEKKCKYAFYLIWSYEDERDSRRQIIGEYDYSYDGGYELWLDTQLEAQEWEPPWWEAPLERLRPLMRRRLYNRVHGSVMWLLGAPMATPRWVVWFWSLPLSVQRRLKSLLYHLGEREAAWGREETRQRREAA